MFGGVELHPSWLPSLDGLAAPKKMILRTSDLCRFERTPFHAAKVRNVSRVGSQIFSSLLILALREGRSPAFFFSGSNPSRASFCGMLAGAGLISVGTEVNNVCCDEKAPRTCIHGTALSHGPAQFDIDGRNRSHRLIDCRGQTGV